MSGRLPSIIMDKSNGRSPWSTTLWRKQRMIRREQRHLGWLKVYSKKLYKNVLWWTFGNFAIGRCVAVWSWILVPRWVWFQAYADHLTMQWDPALVLVTEVCLTRNEILKKLSVSLIHRYTVFWTSFGRMPCDSQSNGVISTIQLDISTSSIDSSSILLVEWTCYLAYPIFYDCSNLEELSCERTCPTNSRHSLAGWWRSQRAISSDTSPQPARFPETLKRF